MFWIALLCQNSITNTSYKSLFFLIFYVIWHRFRKSSLKTLCSKLYNTLSHVYFDLVKKKIRPRKEQYQPRCFVSLSLSHHFRPIFYYVNAYHTRVHLYRRGGTVLWHYQNYYCYTTSLGITRKRINRVVILRRAKCVYSPEKFSSTNDTSPLFIITLYNMYKYCVCVCVCYGILSVQWTKLITILLPTTTCFLLSPFPERSCVHRRDDENV